MESISLNSFVLLEHIHCSFVADFNTRNKLLTQKLLRQGYRYHKLRKTFFSKFYRRYYDLISNFQVGLKSLLRQELSEPDFYGHFPVGILGQVWYLIVSIPDLCTLTYFYKLNKQTTEQTTKFVNSWKRVNDIHVFF